MGAFTRRTFLLDGSALALCAALPARASANETLRVAVVGVRGRGLEHVRAYAKRKDVHVAAVCDVDENVIAPAMKAAEAGSGRAPVYGKDLRKLLEDKSIDAVSIASTNHTHALFSIWSLQAGKHVYVEKPVSHNVREGRRIVEAARKYGRICQAGTQSRSSKAIQDAVRFLHEGGIGKINTARGLCYKPRPPIGLQEDGPVPPGVDYDLWLGPAPVRPFNPNRFHYQWHWQWDTGNGDIGNQGIHQMDLCRWGLGKRELPARVLSVGGRFGEKDDGETPNTQLAVFDYGEQQIVFEVRGMPTREYREVRVGVVFHAEGGWLRIGKGPPQAFDRDDAPLKTFEGGGDHFGNFVDACRGGKASDLAADIEEGHLSSALCHLANVSHRLGGLYAMYKVFPFREWDAADSTFDRFKDHCAENDAKPDVTQLQVGRLLAVDPRTERCPEDPEAERLLTRDYRRPFVVPDVV
jgi:predicted dehydrogenase